MKDKPKKRPIPKSGILVAPGQTYRVRRDGKPALHVRIVRVLRADPQQPKARYLLVTRTGTPKQRRYPEENLNVCYLTFLDGAWQMPTAFELVEEES